MKKTNLLLLTLFFIAITAHAQKPQLKFKSNKFKIIQFTDLHLIKGGVYDAISDSTFDLVRSLIIKEKPDLAVFTGDIVVSGAAKELWTKLMNVVAAEKVPFVVAFGNHDTETDLTLDQTLTFLQSNPYNLTYNADPAISGAGNCAITVKNASGGNNKWVLYFFDSHAYSNNPLIKDYDWIKNDQIQWYRKQSDVFTKENGSPLPSLAFFHIPLPEYAVISKQNTTVGNVNEDVCSAKINTGLFSSFVEMKDVLGVFTGHDHNNDYIGTLYNVALAYGRKTGYASAYKETLERGARIINIYEHKSRFDTYITTPSGTFFHFTAVYQ